MITSLRLATLVFVIFGLIWSAISLTRSHSMRSNYLTTLRAMRPWMVLSGIVNIAVVLGVTILLMNIAPFLSIGWWNLLGGKGSAALSQTGQTGVGWQVLSVVVPLVLLALIPTLAHDEEIIFRSGSEDRNLIERLRWQLGFGLIHLVMGVPIAAGLALTISGFYFEHIYLRVVRPLIPEIKAAGKVKECERLPYPKSSAGARDPEEWLQHLREAAHVLEENERRFEEWKNGLADQITACRESQNAIRSPGVAKAAAAHAVSNVMLVTFALADAVFLVAAR